MKRAVLDVKNPQDYIDQLTDYSIMIINNGATDTRKKYLLEKSDYSLLITDQGTQYRNGQDYPNERVLWYTSGTTGDSKFCSFSQQQVDTLAEKICRAYNITSNDRYVSVMSLSHAHGQGLYWATKRAGCETHFLTPKEIRNLPDYQPTFVSAIPDILNVISNFNLNHLRFVRGASSALPSLLYTHLKERFNVPVIEAFGMTEALSHCFTNPLYGEQRIGTVGLPDGIEADIVEGQLYIKGPTLFQEGWYNTGDLAEKDEAGYYKILGRHRDQINIKGKKFNPLSLEEQLKNALPDLTDCVIFGSDRIKCLYTGDCNPNQIKKFLTNLDSHCVLSLLHNVDSIPVSPSGKISRSWLDQQY